MALPQPLISYQAPANLLTGRTILVTGASDGIGAACAEGFAAFGATVILHGRDNTRLDALHDRIRAAGYPEPAILPLDLDTLTPELCQQAHDWLQDTVGHLDGLLHNAAVLGDRSPIEHTKPERWQQVLQINLTAPFLLTRALLPLLRAAEDASIVFTSSSVGRQGRAHWGAYAVSKFGLEGLMQVLADELANISAIRVNSLNPGAARTRMRRNAYPGEDPTALPAPESLLPAFLYLLGPDSRGINGQALDAR